MMVIESWVLMILSATTDRAEVRGGVGVFTSLRLLRFLRITRVARICQFFPELRTMAAGMVMCIRSVLVTSVLLLTVTYAFAVSMRELGISSAWGEEHFGSVPGALYTLLFANMFPDSVVLMEQMLQTSWFSAGLYYVFLLLSSVMMMNMLIGVVCDGICKASDTERDERHVELMCAKLHEIISNIDQDHDGIVSKEEFNSIMENEHAVSMLCKVGVDVSALVSEADFIFHEHDETGLPFEEFKDEVLRFRRSSVVTNGTAMATQRLLHFSLEHIAARLQEISTFMVEHNTRLADVPDHVKTSLV